MWGQESREALSKCAGDGGGGVTSVVSGGDGDNGDSYW